jgi:hypothetical protein
MSTSTQPHSQTRRNTAALAGLVIGVLAAALTRLGGGNTALLVLGLLLALAALAASFMGLRQAAQSGKGRNWALTGMVVGGIALVVAIVTLVSG